ncbi:6-bladed beta-propeller [Paraprevotella xylaniphila]|uniref:6-bladed beta-propeller n=1 Tax=Paraprevotella xylaniphila TaxID=454155 RepID=UPI0023F16DA6|nr:6-bladed beta-propeller [Paraprevotella xylaniphila]
MACLGLSLSCQSTKVNTVGDEITVEYQDGILKTSSFLKDYRIVLLKAPNNDAIIKYIDRLLFAENRIFVVDQISNKILAFDGNGEFLASTARMVGKGHNEYIRIVDAAIDEKGHKLYVHCDAPYQIMVFDFNLKLEKIFPMEYYLNEMAMDGNYIYGLRHNSMDDSGYEIISIAKDSLASSPNIVLSTPISVRGRKAMGKSMVSNQGSIYASIPFDNKICKLKDGKVTESYIIDFGGQGLPNRPIEKDMSPETFDRLYSDTHWSMVNMSGSDSLLLFNTNRSPQFILDQKNKKCDAYGETFNDMLPFSNSYITPSQGLENGMAYEIEPEVLLKYSKHAEQNHESIDPALLNVIRQTTPDGNPLIILWHLK